MTNIYTNVDKGDRHHPPSADVETICDDCERVITEDNSRHTFGSDWDDSDAQHQCYDCLSIDARRECEPLEDFDMDSLMNILEVLHKHYLDSTKIPYLGQYDPKFDKKDDYKATSFPIEEYAIMGYTLCKYFDLELQAVN